MDCPYQKPAYLTDDQKMNCYATNRGWVILNANGKYDVVESIKNLDQKIASWHSENESEHKPEPIKEEHKQAHANMNRVVLEQRLEEVKQEIKKVDKKIKEVTETAPVLEDEVKIDSQENQGE